MRLTTPFFPFDDLLEPDLSLPLADLDLDRLEPDLADDLPDFDDFPDFDDLPDFEDFPDFPDDFEDARDGGDREDLEEPLDDFEAFDERLLAERERLRDLEVSEGGGNEVKLCK